MNRIFLTFTVFAMIVSLTITMAHACVDIDISNDTSISQQLDDTSDSNPSNKDKNCDIACGGDCIHHITSNHNSINNNYVPKEIFVSSKKNILLSNYAYGFKRPPRI